MRYSILTLLFGLLLLGCQPTEQSPKSKITWQANIMRLWDKLTQLNKLPIDTNISENGNL